MQLKNRWGKNFWDFHSDRAANLFQFVHVYGTLIEFVSDNLV